MNVDASTRVDRWPPSKHLAAGSRTASAFLLWSGLLGATCVTAADPHRAAAPEAQILRSYGNRPLAFIENRGQTDASVPYYAQGPNYVFGLTRDAALFSITENGGGNDRVAFALRFLDANPVSEVVGRSRAPGGINYLVGNDPSRWMTGLSRYREVVYRGLWPRVDMVVLGEGQTLKYEFRVQPGGSLADISLAYDGVSGIGLDPSGGLQIVTPLGVLQDAAPVAYQAVGESRVGVDVHYELRRDPATPGRFGFVVTGEYDTQHELVIDPGIDFSTFLGGDSGDHGAGIAIDESGNVYVVGTTQSLDFPVTAGALDTTPNNSDNSPDVFVSKLDPSGATLVYSTYLGGSQGDFGRAMALDSAGNVYVTGTTLSFDFPTTPGAFDTTPNPSQTNPPLLHDGFVTKINATGSGLVYSTYLGGSSNDDPRSIATDALGRAYVTGETSSSGFPTTPGAFDTTHNGGNDVFVTKFDASGSQVVYSTFLAGSLNEIVNRIRVDSSDRALIVGATTSTDFPTTPAAFDTTHNGGFDVVVAKLDAAGANLLFSTFVGGIGTDFGNDVASDAFGNAHVSGSTTSTDFPVTASAYDGQHGGSSDVFLLKLDSSASTLIHSTFLGGAGSDSAVALGVDGAGTIWVAGTTGSPDFPVTADGTDLTLGGQFDVFLSRLTGDGTDLLYATFIGGSNADNARDLTLDQEDDVYVTGETHSADFPTTPGALDTVWNGDPLPLWGDGFVMKWAAGGAPGTGAPGEAKGLVIGGIDAVTGNISFNYTPACRALDHNVVFGPLSGVAAYGYTGQVCDIGTSGSYSQFAPGPGSYFFLVVGTDGLATDGSYGKSSAHVERPEDTADPICSFTQQIGAPCGAGDATPPVATLTQPTDGATVGGTVALTADATDDVGVTAVRFYVDSMEIAVDPSAPYGANWDTTSDGDGPHTVTASAFDAAGNRGDSAVVNVTVDNSAVSVSLQLTGVPATIPRGDFFTISATAQNDGTTTATGLTVDIDWNPQEPLRLENPQTTTQSYGALSPGAQEALQWEFRGDNQGLSTITITLRDSVSTVLATDDAQVEVLD